MGIIYTLTAIIFVSLLWYGVHGDIGQRGEQETMEVVLIRSHCFGMNKEDCNDSCRCTICQDKSMRGKCVPINKKVCKNMTEPSATCKVVTSGYMSFFIVFFPCIVVGIIAMCFVMRLFLGEFGLSTCKESIIDSILLSFANIQMFANELINLFLILIG